MPSLQIYIFLWFWMFVLGALTFLVVVYRVLICISGDVRSYLLKIRYVSSASAYTYYEPLNSVASGLA